MIFGKRRGPRSTMSIALLACLAFVALAIYGWNLPVSKALEFFWICLLMVFVLGLAAGVVVFLFKWIQKIFRGD